MKQILSKQYIQNKQLQYKFSDNEISEYIKCYNDPIYFIETYCKIHTSFDEKLIKLYDSQKESIYNYFNSKNNIYLSARQSGTDLVLSLIFLYQLTFFNDFSISIISNKLKNNQYIIETINHNYRLLPLFLKQEINSISNTSIYFKNGSFIRSTNNPIGYNTNVYYLHDFAYMKNQKQIFDSIYPISTSLINSKMIINSTPNGSNFFSSLLTNKEIKSTFSIQKIYWDQIPNRNNNWKEEIIKIIGEEEFNQSYNLKFISS